MKSPLTLRRLLKTTLFLLFIGIILFAGIALRNFLLRQLQQKVGSFLTYSEVKISLFPAGLVFEDVKLRGENPSFRARRFLVRTKLLSFSQERPVKIFIDEAVIHYRSDDSDKGGPSILTLPAPFVFEEALLRKAELYLELGKESFAASDLKVIWKRKGDRFHLQAEAPGSTLFLSAKEVISSAKFKIFLEGRGQEMKLRRFLMEKNDSYVLFKGIIKSLTDPEVNLNGKFWLPMESVDTWLKLPFSWEGNITSEGQLVRRGGRWTYEGSILSSNMKLNDYPLSPAEGWLGVTLGKRGDLNIRFSQDPEKPELSVSWESGRVAGRFAQFHLDPVLKELGLPWPVKSPSWGSFNLVDHDLLVEGELRENDFQTEGNRYPFQGPYRIEWDGQKRIQIWAPEFLSNFARFQVQALINLGQNLDVQIKSEIVDVALTRLFLQELLKRQWNFPEIKGQAEAKVIISGSPALPDIFVEFEGSPFCFGRFEETKASGQFKIVSRSLEGDFRFFDPRLTGTAKVKIESSGISAIFDIQNGEWDKALPALGIRFPLKGKFSGLFRLNIDQNGFYSVHGDFFSPKMIFLGQTITEGSGEITWANNTFNLNNFKGQLASGQVAGRINLDFSEQRYSLDLSGQRLFLSSFISGLKGEADLNLWGQGFLGQDQTKGNFRIKDFAFSLFEQDLVEGEAEIIFTLEGLKVDLRSFNQREGGFDLSLTSSFSRKQYSLEGKGKANLSSLIPWKGASGDLNYLIEIKMDNGKRQTTGVLEANGSLLPIPNFPHALNDYNLLVFIRNQNLSVSSFRGKIGGGEVKGFGEVKIGPGGQVWLDLQVDGQDLVLSPFDRTRFLSDGSLRLIRNQGRFALEGEFLVKKASWRREFFEKITFSSMEVQAGLPEFWRGLTLSLRLRAEDQAWVENSLARIRGGFDLTITGEIGSPIILGEIEAIEGSIYFQERNFRLLKGKLTLTNPLISAPHLEMTAETYVQDYRVTFSLTGLTDRLKPEFASSPPLAQEEVLALLAFGESFKRITSTDVVSQASTASFLSGEIIEEAKKRAQKILSLDRLRIDPFILGSSAEMTARLTVGKKISENFFIIYSTNLTTQREEIVRVEWELKPGLSIVGIRDEMGRLSLDLKIRRRF